MIRRLTLRELAQLLGLLALSLLAGFLAPRLPLGDIHPLGGMAGRIAAGLAVLLCGGLVLGWRWHRRRLMARGAGGAGPGAGGARSLSPAEDELRLALGEALAWTHERQGRAGRTGDGAYALPWVLLAGTPGSGRSSLVTGAGFEAAPQPHPMAGGTCWLGEEAVLFEPPGAWFTQGGDTEPMERLAGALLAARPRRPLDAVVLAIPATALLLDPRGAMVGPRVRLQLLMRALGAEPPLHLVITGTDRLPGFQAAFAPHQGVDARGLALGAEIAGHGDAAAALRTPLQALAAGAGQRLPHDLAAERDMARRCALLLWPTQLERLAAAALEAVQELTRFGPGDRRPDLRGLHLAAAGHAAGPAADAWQKAIWQAFALDGLPPPPAPGGPSFVAGMLRGIVLAGAGLGGANAAAERRTALWHVGGYAAALGLLALVTLLWGSAFGLHRATQANLAERVDRLVLEERALEAQRDQGLDQILAMLNSATAVADAWSREDSSWLGLALPRSHLTFEAARRARDRLLLHHLLPFFRQRLVAQIVAASDPVQLRGLLRIYLASASADHFDAAAFRAWATPTGDAVLALQPERQAELRRHIERIATLLPQPSGLDDALVAETRMRLRVRPEAERIYAELRQQAERSSLAPPVDVVGSLGLAGAQLLMLRHQAGLAVVVPGFYTRNGFFSVFLPRLPVVLQGDADDAFVMGADNDQVGRQELLQRVTQLYVADYVRNWRGVVEQTALRALPDLPSLVGGVQALAGPDSPLTAFLHLVRDNTDLQPPGDQAAGLLGRAAAAVGGAAAQNAVEAAAGATSGLPGGVRDWPGNAIRLPFLPLIDLAGPRGTATANPRVLGPVTTAFGSLSGIASAASPAVAAHQAAAAAVGGTSGDPFAALQTQAATLPGPVAGILRDLHSNIWHVVMRLAMERVASSWSTDVAPACLQSIARRYPFSGGGELDVLPRDFAAFFGPAGTLDRWSTTVLMPFVQVAADGSLVPMSRNGLRLGIAAEALIQLNRAQQLRELFFDSTGSPAVRLAVTPIFLDARALSATLQVDATRQVYRHEPPRPVELRWPGVEEGGVASIALAMTDGTLRQVQGAGPWALFRLLDNAERAGNTDRQRVSFQLGDARIAYALRGSSVRNPFASRDWREFRCLARL